MVNVRAIANRATQGVNPNITATLRAYTGRTTTPSGKQVPGYAPAAPVVLQAQAMTKKDIEHTSGLNISRVDRVVYADVQLTGVDRARSEGGDLLVFEGKTWLVTAVLEDWTSTAGWCKVALTQQVDT